MQKYLKSIGYKLVRVKGSHFHYKRSDGTGYLITVAIHGNKEIKLDTLENIIFYIAKNESRTEDEIRQEIADI
jgi:predicted RNA binding protein YcfA (HicA-like mRNA interferase family)